MEIFLSWSKDWSHELSQAFRDWVPLVLQESSPFMSSTDIDLGTRWNDKINNQLEKSTVGILFLTPENIDSPWLNFEAGALSKSIGSESKIIPISFGSGDLTVKISKTPLKQFQSLLHPDKKGFNSLITTLNTSMENSLSEKQLKTTFEMWWPALENDLKKINQKYENKTTAIQKKGQTEKLTASEALISDMSDKVDLLLRQQMRRPIRPINVPQRIVEDLSISLHDLESFEKMAELKNDDRIMLGKIMNEISGPIHHLAHYSIHSKLLSQD
ncbi:toll/interleukin-1 receptor domain-containing protein [Lacticaseibacillus paracasei]|uniref:toll/interleukin-1 receptor domain-containing protein n=1 Tax=Lacticaseibacillus paracasei TaxID=1597 RepID=UPI001EDDA102|nr:toll/interleukin-1 receptor domain-containing protein [Lacticaseibacillus paracasei]MCG4284455.1 toll/interleukin-1 receptor domain-containing protein [Lacticaseibacillus paracasei]